MREKIIVIPDSFKGSMSSEKAADILAAAIEKVTPYEPVRLPIADGGEGSTACIIRSLGGVIKKARVHSPENAMIDAAYGIAADGTAVLEIAESSGITKQSKLNPLSSDTFGYGELIVSALDAGARNFLLCLGGSATTDCGCGMAAALGVRFTDVGGREFVPNGGTLSRISHVDTSGLDERVRECTFTVMSDVTNPLYGAQGAAYVFAPQKGAGETEVRVLDEGLRNAARAMKAAGLIDCGNMKGAGAAGGAGYGCAAFLGAKIVSGIDALLDLCRFDELVRDARMIVTGEGRFDRQSLMGKVVGGIKARSIGKPVTVFCGISGLSESEAAELGIDVVEIGRGVPLAESIERGGELLTDRAEKYFSELFGRGGEPLTDKDEK